MTLFPCELNATQLGLVARAVDVHRQAQVRKLQRTTGQAEREAVLAEIEDLAYAGSMIKAAELELLHE